MLRSLTRWQRVLFGLSGLVLLSAAAHAVAQQPSEAQAGAIRASCRSDYRANCSDVPTGGSAALQCLEKNIAKLSGACQTAVKAVMPAAQPTQSAAAPVKSKTPSATESAPAAPASSATPTPPVPAKPATATAPATSGSAKSAGSSQAAAIKAACRADFPVHCPGVKPGGSAALQCLKANAASLSKPCQDALLAAGGGGSSGAAAEKAPAKPGPAATPAAAPAISLPPRQALFALRNACAGDVQSYCASVPLGGGRALACLGAHSASLSPGCKAALRLP